MAKVEIRIHDRPYQVTCDDGQESRLARLADHLDSEVRALSAELGDIGETRLILLAALTCCDALFEARERLQAIDADAAPPAPETAAAAAKAIEAAARRLEALSDRLVGR